MESIQSNSAARITVRMPGEQISATPQEEDSRPVEPIIMLGFDYGVVPSDKKEQLKETERVIERRLHQTIQTVVEIGKALNWVKREVLSYGQLEEWIQKQLPISRQTAFNMMAVADAFPHLPEQKYSALITLEAVYRLSTHPVPGEAREEAMERAANGERITLAVAREIINRRTGGAAVSHKSLPAPQKTEIEGMPVVDSETVMLLTGLKAPAISKLERKGVLKPVAQGPGLRKNGREYKRAYYPKDVVAYLALKQMGKMPPTREELADTFRDDEKREGFITGIMNPNLEIETKEMSKAFIEGHQIGLNMSKRFPSRQIFVGEMA
jgi:hypothetical protein